MFEKFKGILSIFKFGSGIDICFAKFITDIFFQKIYDFQLMILFWL